MATLVAFHAHPDDESIAQAGTLARAADEGHRTVLVYATGGEVGQVPVDFLHPGETLVERRMQEAQQSAEILRVGRVAWLGYRDSGMQGTPDNDHPACFSRADPDRAAAELAAILREERADVLTIYDRNGNYGHPDHVQVHRVGVRAAELAETPHVLELTINRDRARRLLAGAAAAGMSTDDMPDLDDPDVMFGMPEEVITTTVDVRSWIDRKRASMAAHASQSADTAPLLAMSPDMFREGLGFEYYIRRGVPSSHREDDVFAGVDSDR